MGARAQLTPHRFKFFFIGQGEKYVYFNKKDGRGAIRNLPHNFRSRSGARSRFKR